MSNEHDNSVNSTPLHLGRFAPDAADTKTSMPTVDPGLTITVKRAASEIVKQGSNPILPAGSGELPGKAFLGAVSYCYAKGVYTSEEIEDKMRQDPRLSGAVHGEVPSASAIRRFRRLNRAAIEQTLTKAFGYFSKKRDRPAVPCATPAGVPNCAPAPGDTTIIYARHQAEDRVQEAAFVDNMSKD
jgi:hypothetical protein